MALDSGMTARWVGWNEEDLDGASLLTIFSVYSKTRATILRSACPCMPNICHYQLICPCLYSQGNVRLAQHAHLEGKQEEDI